MRTVGAALVTAACGSTVTEEMPSDGGSSQVGGSAPQAGAMNLGGLGGMGSPIGGARGVGGAGGIGGIGGAGGTSSECTMASDCGADAECEVHICDGGACIVETLVGELLDDPEGNCQQRYCDSAGPVNAPDVADPPADAPCFNYECDTAGTITTEVKLAYPCGGGFYCDAEGDCVACVAQPPCIDWPCPSIYQTWGNCTLNMCADEDTAAVAVVDDLDVPMTPAPECMVHVCDEGAPVLQPAPAGTACHGGDGACDGLGQCVCVSNCECGADADCAVAQYCVASACHLGFCESEPVIEGVSPYQVPGDCQQMQCATSGPSPYPAAWDTPPSVQCATPACMPGPDYFQYPPGTPCSTGFCNGFFSCVACFGGQGTCPAGSHCPPAPSGAGFCVPD